MNIKFFNVALGIALTATTIGANAQKTYTQGVVMMSTDMRGQPVEIKDYFTPDSSAMAFTAGPASIKLLTDAKSTFFAVLVDVPVASIKKAAIYTPAEIEAAMDAMPKLTFAPAADTKSISGFNCKKVVATDPKTSKTYDIWITNDVTLPQSAIPKYYASIGGVPIQYTSFSQGQEASVTVTGITDAKAPAGTFTISSDFDKITADDLKAMSGGNN
ncbi:MAG TPA: hypothetical protein VGI43_03030 [Mucilaginibacter sp.]|jgi:hypothetical protein